MYKCLFVLIISGLFNQIVSGQCPDKTFLWKRIVFLRDSSTIDGNTQLTELLRYSKGMQNCSSRFDSSYALLLQRIGLLYYKKNDFVNAIEFTRQSIEMVILNAGKPSVNYNHLIKSYNNLKIYYDSLDDLKSKAEAIDSCIAISLRTRAEYKYAKPLLADKVVHLLNIGDYHQCISYASMGETIARESVYDTVFALNFFAWKINALLFLKNYAETEQLLLAKLRESKIIGHKEYLGTWFAQLAELETYKGNASRALQYYYQSFRYDKEAGYLLGCSQIQTNIGYFVYFKLLKNYQGAIHHYKKSLVYLNRVQPKTILHSLEALNIYDNIGNVYVQQEMYDSAFYFFQLAFNQLNYGANENSISHFALDDFISYNKIQYLTNLIMDKADAYLSEFKLKKNVASIQAAIRIYKVADLLVDRIRIEYAEVKSALFWRNSTRRLYEHAIEACYLINDHKEAFYFFEKSRAVLLADQLMDQHKSSDLEISKLSVLKKIILKEERELQDLSLSPDQLKDIQQQVFIHKQELEKLQKIIRQHNPLFYQNIIEPTFIELNDVNRKLIKNQNTLVELFEGDSAVYSLIITPSKLYFRQINKVTFDRLTSLFIAYCSNPSIMNKDFSGFVTTSSNLYDLLFQTCSLAGKVIISPDKHLLSFEALLTNKNSSSPSYLIQDHAVSYTYSARYLLNHFESNSMQATHNLIGIAPIQFPAKYNLPVLTGSDKSLKNLPPVFADGNHLIAAAASRSNFLNQFSNYKIIQLYTHASGNGPNREPMINFADSALNLSELISTGKPVTSLIVLSACETGTGQVNPGEGIFSFSRGFAALGIPSSINNLWSVNDQSTYRLTELFYKHLAKELPIDIALQKAKIEFLQTASKENSLPYYWAATVLTGKTDAIRLIKSPRFDRSYIFIVVVVMALSFWSLRRISHEKPTNPIPGTRETLA